MNVKSLQKLKLCILCIPICLSLSCATKKTSVSCTSPLNEHPVVKTSSPRLISITLSVVALNTGSAKVNLSDGTVEVYGHITPKVESNGGYYKAKITKEELSSLLQIIDFATFRPQKAWFQPYQQTRTDWSSPLISIVWEDREVVLKIPPQDVIARSSITKENKQRYENLMSIKAKIESLAGASSVVFPIEKPLSKGIMKGWNKERERLYTMSLPKGVTGW